MSNHTQTATAHPYLSPEWLYDTLMGHIEPDLMLGNIQDLDEKYKGESEDHRKMRASKYELAFLLYEDCLSELDWILAEDAMILKQEMKEYADLLEKNEQNASAQGAEDELHSHGKA